MKNRQVELSKICFSELWDLTDFIVSAALSEIVVG